MVMPRETDMIFTKEQVEQFRYDTGSTTGGALEAMHAVAHLCAEHIRSLIDADDLIEADSFAFGMSCAADALDY